MRTKGGATRLSVHHAAQGVITRDVLLDIPAVHGVPWLQPGHAITPDELIAAEERQGVTVRAGDALFVRTGNFARTAAEGPHPEDHAAGLSAATLPFLRERDVALLSTDGQQEVSPADRPTSTSGCPFMSWGWWRWGSGSSTTQTWTSSHGRARRRTGGSSCSPWRRGG